MGRFEDIKQSVSNANVAMSEKADGSVKNYTAKELLEAGINPSNVEKYDKTIGTGTASDPFRTVGTTLYRDGAGKLSDDINNSMSFTFGDGEVNIVATKEMQDTDWMQEFINNSAYKQLYEAYKNDPTGTTEISNGEGGTYTINEALAKLQEAFNTTAAAQRDVNNVRKKIVSATGVKLSDKDMKIYSHSANRSENKNDSDVVVYIPETAVAIFPELKTLGSYNEEYGTISAKDFYGWYNTDNGAVDKDKKINLLNDLLSSFIGNFVYDEKSEDPAGGATEYAKAVSLKRTLDNDAPENAALTSAKIFTWQSGASFAHNLAGVGYTVVSLMEQIPVVNQGVKALEAGLYLAGGEMSGVDDKKLASTLETIWSVGAASELMGQLDFVDKKLYEDLKEVSSAATAGALVGGAAAEIVKQILITNPIGAAVGGTTSVLVSGLTTSATLGTTFKNGIKALLTGMDAKELGMAVNAASNLLGTSANILGQGVCDAVLDDPMLLNKALSGDNGDEVMKALAVNTAGNLFGELAGVGSSKIVEKLADTRLGIGIQKLAYEAAAKKLDMQVKFAEKLKGMGIKVDDKVIAGYKLSAENSRKAADMIAKAASEGASKSELIAAKNASRAFKAQTEYAIKNEIKNSESTAYSMMMNDKNISQAFNSAMKSADAVYKLEKSAGMTFRKGQYISAETSNYIAAKQRVMNLAPSKNLTDVEKDILNTAQSIVSHYEATVSTELKAAVEELESNLGKAYHAQVNFELSNHILPEQMENKILELRKGGRWGEDGDMYIGTIAIKEGENATEAVTRWLSGSRRDFEGITSGFGKEVKSASEEYLDPVNTLLARQINDAQRLSAINNRRLLAASDISSVEIDINGKPLSRAEFKKAKKAYDNINERVNKAFLTEDINSFDFSGAFRSNKRAAKSVLSDPGRMDRAIGLRSEKEFANAAYKLDDNSISVLKESGLDIPTYDTFSSDSEFRAWFDTLDDNRKAIIEQSVGGSKFLDSTSYNKALSETTMVSKLNKYDIANNKDIINSDTYKNFVREFKKQNLTARQEAFYKKYYDRYVESLSKLEDVSVGKDEFSLIINDFTEGLKETYKSVSSGNKYVQGIYEELSNRGIPVDLVDDYFTMTSLRKFVDSKEFGELVSKNLNDLKVAGNVTNEERVAIIDSLRNSIKENVNSEWAEAAQNCMYNGVSDFIDMADVNKYVTNQMKEFTDTINQPNVMKIIGNDGEYHIVQLSPLMSDFINAESHIVRTSSFASKLIRKSNQVFRLGATGINLRSMVNQFARDPINAWIVGGIDKTFKLSEKELSRYFGGMPIERIEKELGDQYKVLIDEMQEAGIETTQKNVADAAAKKMGEEAKNAYSGMSIQEQYYADTLSDVSYGKDSLIGKTAKEIKKGNKGAIDRFNERMQKLLPNSWRENVLRRTVYMNNLEKAIRNGHTVQEAKSIATYIADNATTDFSRTFAWGNGLVRHVPYLGAAINGTSSFWRLLEIDPVGISCRFMGGMVFPTVALTAQSLSGENLDVYKNIPEYEKENSLVFVVDGSKFSLPIPQELSAFIKPFRQAVEKMAGVNDHSWTELLANDILSISPIDIDGFVDLDNSSYIKDKGFFDRVSDLSSSLISQLSPESIKTAYMVATGIDPYTGNKIDKRFTIVDENGVIQTMDYTTDSFAVWMAGVLGDDVSPSQAYAIIKSLFGQGIANIASDIVDVIQGNYESIIDREAETVSKPFYKDTYDIRNTQFNDDVKTLTEEKNKLMASDGEIAKLNQKILNETDKTKLEKMRTEVRQLEQDYAEKVKTMVDNYVADGGKYGKDQVYKVISLLTLNATTNDLTTDYARNNAKQVYYDSVQQAKDYLRNLGFKNTNDYSMLGYLSTNDYGEVKSRLVVPSQIQGISGAIHSGSKIALANIDTALTDSGLNYNGDAYNKMQDEVSKAYSSKNYKLVDKIYKEWDTKVMDVIAPIIAQNDVGDMLNYNEVIDYLDNVIKVPSDAMGEGKYYSAKTGLNKQRGYAKSYIQKLYANLKK